MKKTTASVLIATLLLTLALAYLPSTATASPTTITMLTHWTEPEEVWYWGNVTKAYNEVYGPGDVEITMQTVEMDLLYETIITRHAGNNDPDIMHIHAMWVPSFANWVAEILAIPPSDVQADVRDNWTPVTTDGVTYKGFQWGYPSEFNSWALVYNRYLFETEIDARGAETPEGILLTNVLTKLENDVPLSYTELKDSARLFAKWGWVEGEWMMTHAGFCPFIEGMPEEQRYQFQSLLWSNGGDYVDLAAPVALFNDQSGYEVMQLYYDLGYNNETEPIAYDPQNMPDYWWDAWAEETVAMMILPTWMTYVRDAMGARFDHLGIAPIPIGPSGTESVSATYNWLNAVSEKADKEGRADAAWDFLRWINEPRANGTILLPGAGDIGNVPKGDGCSIMGDYLIYDSIVPSRVSDLENGRLTVDDPPLNQGPLISEDFWFEGFRQFGSPPYGRSDVYFTKSEEAQYHIGTMFETVVTLGVEPPDPVDDAADEINEILPMAGDINLDGPVDIYDAVILIIDWDATPEPWTPPWNRGRSDVDDDLEAGLGDAIIIVLNWGRE